MLNEKHSLKEKIGSGAPVMGTWNTLSAPLVTELMAKAGFDFQIIDYEHGPFDLNNFHMHVNACRAHGCSPLARLPKFDDWMILQVLDQGGDGVVVPHMENKDDVESFIKSIKYFPEGSRGFSPFTKAGGFNNREVPKHVSESNINLLSIAIIESKQGLENLEEILSVPGLDVVYFGAYDISQALGHPGETKHSDVIRAISKGVQQVNAAGKCAGGFVPQSSDDVKMLLDMGIQFITYDVDSSILHNSISEVTEWFAKETA